jgi:hypothetical protein
MVTITNYGSASDGDQFPFFFRKFNLGKLVGERTWGGVQGINRDWTLMDGTPFTIPKDSLASLGGHWVIENEGVAPDIPVEPPPDEAVTHGDLELQVAVRTALEQLTLRPPQILKAPHPLPAYPPKEALRRVLMMSLRCRIGAEVGIGAGYCSGSDLCGFEGLYFGLQAQFYPSTARRLRCR